MADAAHETCAFCKAHISSINTVHITADTFACRSCGDKVRPFIDMVLGGLIWEIETHVNNGYSLKEAIIKVASTELGDVKKLTELEAVI